MKSKKKILIASTAAAVAVMTAAGVTLAVTLTDNDNTGYVSTAKVEVTARADNVKVYSAKPASATDKDMTDENGNHYKYELSNISSEGKTQFTAHEGSVVYTDKSITISNFMPGDKVEFDILVSSTSTIGFRYRAELYVDADSKGKELLNQLGFSTGKSGKDLSLTRRDITETSTLAGEAAAVLTDYTDWTQKSTNDKQVESVTVSVWFPIEATAGQGETVKFYYNAKAVQTEEVQPDVAEVEVDGTAQPFKTLSEAVKYAEEAGKEVITIKNIGDGNSFLEEGNINLNKRITFKGERNANNAKPIIRGARFTVGSQSAVTFENIIFEGESYIDVSDSDSLTLKECTVKIDAIKYYDSHSKNFLTDAAFVVSGNSNLPVKLNLEGNTFISAKGAAVCLSTRLKDGSVLKRNVFGSAERVFDGKAVLMLNGARDGATVVLEDNKLYGKLPVLLGDSDTGYKIISKQNNAFGTQGGLFVSGSGKAVFLDNGSKADEQAITLANISDKLLFGGVNTETDESGRITAGNFELFNIKLADFDTVYVTAGAIVKNKICVYEEGKPSYYLNSMPDGGHDVENIK